MFYISYLLNLISWFSSFLLFLDPNDTWREIYNEDLYSQYDFIVGESQKISLRF